MMDKDQHIDAQAAKAALKDIESSQQNLQKAMRLPVWLSVFSSLSYGLIVFSWGMTEHENLWALGLYIGLGLFLASAALAMYSSKLMGLKANLIPKNKSGLLFYLVSVVAFGLLVLGGRTLRLEGFASAPHIAAFLSAALMFYFQYWHPAGEMQRIGADDE
ncbi:hypothetical protein [Pseudoteredinibacter isoporae]|uniref:Asparagine N-glycosylation enzyme membrane subunit Stt3 n=1 Tax=Pseudoteredinibacter isoporae TaxID=570281 RepID=A0A7X0JU20_9GAMM|nr:hypothetical protein [Pseudoteredinibacter isoporae]MBB6521331.1 asparagine N-glycosylation enzyme membrane subunit Stt3 [Pseudoteredinibacter isoporae]NHO86886.1 hypothetical protein [Pseudoteredinibacter isoporae]NIB24662.1 hypothetical protein [Pseudoteredinibacter isoporae]